jgi:hypothetical protein
MLTAHTRKIDDVEVSVYAPRKAPDAANALQKAR